MDMNVISQSLAIKYMNAFNDLGWINLDFGVKSRSLLARLNPRIDTQTELVLISTYPSKRKPWIRSIGIDNRTISDVSIVFTDRRVVLLNRSDDKAEEFYFSHLVRWDRSGYSGITGNVTYKLSTKDNRVLEISIQAGGSGWFAFLVGFSNPIARSDALRGANSVEAFVSFFDSFVQAIYNTSHSSIL
jgi:hypothetical protein